MEYARPIARLIEALARLPGIGPKSAQRLALFVLKQPAEEVAELAEAIVRARRDIRECDQCCNLTDEPSCHLCRDPRRDPQVVCVVEEPGDVIALERTREFRGHYHVLHGALSPQDGLGPERLRIKELMERLQDPESAVTEIIVATNPTVEGEATALYLARLIKPLELRVTRLARGMPEGGDLDYVDELTLTRALEGRRDLQA